MEGRAREASDWGRAREGMSALESAVEDDGTEWVSWFEAFTDMRERVRAISSRECVFDNVSDGGFRGHTE